MKRYAVVRVTGVTRVTGIGESSSSRTAEQPVTPVTPVTRSMGNQRPATDQANGLLPSTRTVIGTARIRTHPGATAQRWTAASRIPWCWPRQDV